MGSRRRPPGGAPQRPLYRVHKTMPELFSGVGKTRRRAHQRDTFRRASAKNDSARLSVFQLAAWYFSGCDIGVRNDRGGHRRGRFLWPGFGENLRVLRWVIERSKGGGQANETPIGYVPKASSLSGEGLKVSKADVDQLVFVDREAWKNNLQSQSDFFDTFGDHLP